MDKNDKALYLILGVCIGLVAMISHITVNQNTNEALISKINFQSGCLLIATRINEKQKLSFDYGKVCDKESENIYNTYLDISVQMDKIMGFK